MAKITLKCRKCGKNIIIDKPVKPGNYTIQCDDPGCDGSVRISFGQHTRIHICSNCNSKVAVPEKYSSPQFRCPKCQHINVIEPSKQHTPTPEPGPATPAEPSSPGIKVAVEQITPEELAKRKAEAQKEKWKEQFHNENSSSTPANDSGASKRPMHDPKKYRIDPSKPSHPSNPGPHPAHTPGMPSRPGQQMPAEQPSRGTGAAPAATPPGAHAATMLSGAMQQPNLPQMQRPVMWCELVEKRFLSKKRYQLKPGVNTVGRASSTSPSDISLTNDDSVSRQSLKIEVVDTGGGFTYTANLIRSTNPVLHNGRPMRPGFPEPLNPGDTITLGHTTLTLTPAYR